MVEFQKVHGSRWSASHRRSRMISVTAVFFLSGLLIGGFAVNYRSSRNARKLAADLGAARADAENARQLALKCAQETDEIRAAVKATFVFDCDRYPPPPTTPAVKIEARIVRFDADAGLVQIDRGSDAGAFVGQEIDIVRNGQFIGNFLLDHVGKDYAIGHLGRVQVPGRKPKVGDLATTL